MTRKKAFNEVEEIYAATPFKLLAKPEDYKGVGHDLLVECPKGHKFNSSVDKIRLNCNCPYCEGNARYTKEDVERFLKEHNYTAVDLSTYKNATTSNIKVQCPKGHIFTTHFTYLCNYKEDIHFCPVCGIQRSLLKSKQRCLSQEFVKTYIEEWGYALLAPYENCYTKLKLLCPNGHKYQCTWNKFRAGHRCICKSNRKWWSTEERNQYAENRGFVVISSAKRYVEHMTLQCENGHQFKITFNNLWQGHGCPTCFHQQSKAELEIGSLYSHLNPKLRDRVLIIPLELDLYFPNQKVAIEYCGLYWHSDKAPGNRMTPSYHRNKLDLCNKQGIRLLTIFEDEWLSNKDICISRINSALGIVKDKIHARKCVAKQITNQEAKEFLIKTHLQGPGSCKVAYGLFYNNELVQVMTFGSPARAHTAKGKRVLEMKRLAGKLNTIIVGGASKLFKLGLQYAKANNYEVIKSYCDLRWGTGNLYKQLKFTKTYETKHTPHYTDGYVRYRNQNLAQNKTKTGITEAEVVLKKGLWKIHDCGHQTWEYSI